MCASNVYILLCRKVKIIFRDRKPKTLGRWKFSYRSNKVRAISKPQWSVYICCDNGLNPKIRDWINYSGKVKRKTLKSVVYDLHHRLNKWALIRCKNLRGSRVLGGKWLRKMTNAFPHLFYYRSLGYQLV